MLSRQALWGSSLESECSQYPDIVVNARKKKPSSGVCILGIAGLSFLYIQNLLGKLPSHSADLSVSASFSISLSFLNTLTVKENMCEVLKLQPNSQSDQLLVAMSFFMRNDFKSAIFLNMENTYMCFKIMEC